MTAYCSAPLSPSSDSSVSVPLSFLPFRTRSFVHLICGRTPQVRSTASQAATAPSAVSGSIFSGASCGRSSAERYTPRPGLLEKLRRLAEKYPDQIVKKDRQTFLVPKRCVSVREPYSAERRKAASELAKAAGYRPPTPKKGNE